MTTTSPSPSPALSPVVARLLVRAQLESQSGDAKAAASTMANALSLAPDHGEVLRSAGIVANKRGDYARAAEYFRRALVALPDDPRSHSGLGVALYRLTREDEALAHLRLAIQLAPALASAWLNLAETLISMARTEEAIAALHRALALEPANVQASFSMARAQRNLGRIDEAAAGFRQILQADPNHVATWLALADLKVVALEDADVPRLEAVLAKPDLSVEDRVKLEFVLAKVLEDQGHYPRSFEVLQRANVRQRGREKWDAASQRAQVDEILQSFAGPVAAARDADLGHAAIFIAGLPRSGTSLVEQILASHPEVEGANEIRDLPRVVFAETQRRRSAYLRWVPDATAADWQRLGEEYLASTARWREHKPRFTDKHLINWMLAGVVMAMLPGARMVLVRRDPVESCLACYRQLFNHSAEYSYDLGELADFYIGFWRLTRFWIEKYPGRVLDFEYEALQSDPEATIRGLLDFCGLPFDPACLEFHRTERTVLSTPSAAQVRQPLQRNTARAPRYGHLLDGLRQRLRSAGLPFADLE